MPRDRVYALDMLGYGESDKPTPQLDSADQAKAVIELLDAEKITRAALIGLSWGGGIVQSGGGIVQSGGASTQPGEQTGTGGQRLGWRKYQSGTHRVASEFLIEK